LAAATEFSASAHMASPLVQLTGSIKAKTRSTSGAREAHGQ
jgi:hypothetical protein